MTSIRLRPAGFDARPERPSSLRAQAQRVYREAAHQPATTPLPNPPPQGGREQAVFADAQQTELTQRIRALYEAGVVPVTEIARIAGVSERTLYKYVAKGGWRRRYPAQDIAAAVAKRAAKRKPRSCVTRKGAGGRFIRNEDAGRPVRRGLKALDPAGEARALPKAERAAALGEEALARSEALRGFIVDVRGTASLVRALRLIAAREAGDDARMRRLARKPRRDDERQARRGTRRKTWRPMPGSG